MYHGGPAKGIIHCEEERGSGDTGTETQNPREHKCHPCARALECREILRITVDSYRVELGYVPRHMATGLEKLAVECQVQITQGTSSFKGEAAREIIQMGLMSPSLVNPVMFLQGRPQPGSCVVLEAGTALTWHHLCFRLHCDILPRHSLVPASTASVLQ